MIHVAEDAAEWYKKELNLHEGQSVRFFARYSAGGHIHPGFSLGIDTEEPKKPGLSTTVGGIRFYMEEQDLWYLDGYDLKVSYDGETDDIIYEYVQ
ncbi:HesB/YadR/YfhF family protein [Paenibacillus physcomitrellae]|uniref:FeS cluster biogenesis domain-containing protein n=1 Tax=Paenibacillus physcomitrellae TaxID=1619311 RepID=A0ABQ1G8S8_9BACL|nr:hypothetical protein [Paenibacillus physcomitrellae]GGA38941.1 hypothetical protein GCM10010917_25250 [Paenibacillus physcomitrellae]